jgi:class 3 adenylate cyclase
VSAAIRFVTTADGVRIAYCMHGQGPPLVYVRGWVSHLELLWADDAYRSFFETLARRFTVVRYDARGNGLSERRPANADLDALTLDLEALVDGTGLDQVTLYGTAFGGPIAVNFAARHPQRVSRLVLDGTYARGADIATPEWKERLLETFRAMPDAALLLLSHRTNPDARATEFRRPDRFRELISSEMAARLYALAYEVDVSAQAAEVQAPTLVLHRRESLAVPVREGRRLAALIPDARFVALEGTQHNPWEGDARAALAAMEDFLGADFRLEAPQGAAAGTLTVLFTDIARSTALARQHGDALAQAVRQEHNAIVRLALRAHGGTEVKHTGDGIMASFHSASSAVRCACAIQRAVAERGDADLQVHIGLNAGEPIVEERDLFGAAVDFAARICHEAGPGEVLCSDVVRQLCTGKGFRFADRGEALLRGFDEPVRLHEVLWRSPD